MFSANSSQVSEDRLYVEDVFSTYLYTGNGSTQTITNGIDLAGKGGLVWFKSRSGGSIGGAYSHYLWDTSRGTSSALLSNDPRAAITGFTDGLTSFNANGFSISSSGAVNETSTNYASWTFRKAPKFFDVVTYTGNGANRNIAHSLGVAPGCIIVKRTDAAADWQVYHRSNANTEYMVLNTTAAKATGTTRWNSTTPTATEFTVGTDTTVNASGGTYVAYLFAHDTTSDGIIQCGSFTTGSNGFVPEVNLGWEPQWLLIRSVSGGSWYLIDTMRGYSQTGTRYLYADSSMAEAGWNTPYIGVPTATGFVGTVDSGQPNTQWIYIAIRRGPMRTPTSGTSVYNANSVTTASYSVGFAPDMALEKRRDATFNFGNSARLMGSGWLTTNTTNAYNSTASFFWDEKTGNFRQGFDDPGFVWAFRRAPSFFDVVCYTGTGVARTVNHNLGIVPELMIVKNRSTSGWDWHVYAPSIGNDKYLVLNEVYGQNNGASSWDSTSPTATTFTVGTSPSTNNSGSTHVAYLFASCPGVSKCGSYTGNGSSQTINCGFAAGARFVMIKRTDAAGDWYVWDSARGIVSGNDPHLSLNSTAAEVTTDDSVDTDSSGFVVNQLSATNINVSSATYIYLAVA